MKNQDDFQKFKSAVNSQHLGSVRKGVDNVNWKSRMQLDLVQKPSVAAAEPYCSGSKGSVVGRCDFLNHNCNEYNFFECQCNGDSGKIEKCSKCADH